MNCLNCKKIVDDFEEYDYCYSCIFIQIKYNLKPVPINVLYEMNKQEYKKILNIEYQYHIDQKSLKKKIKQLILKIKILFKF